LHQMGVTTYEEVALMASEEEDVQENFGKIMAAANVAGAKTVIGMINIKKFWVACRKLYNSDKTPQTDSSIVDAHIPLDDEIDIKAKWFGRHTLVLPDAFLLVASNQGKMWRDANATPPQIALWLAEVLRTRSCVDKSVGHQLSIVPGKAAETLEVIADSVARPFELYIRIRAFFMTLSYVSVTRPTWFPLQMAVQASEQILGHIMSTYEGKSPPTHFLVSAWASTIHHFSEQVRLTGRDAHEVIGNAGAWEHRWKWSPSSGSSGSRGGLQQQQYPDNSSKLQSQVDAMKEQVKRFQSQQVR
jgi:hypothetical protein